MAGDADDQVPEGAAVFPLIPAELGINPLLLAVVHATVFLAGSDEEVVDATAADEAVGYLAGYLQRLTAEQLQAVREDMECLARYARQQQWPKQLIRSVQSFLTDYGVEQEEESE